METTGEPGSCVVDAGWGTWDVGCAGAPALAGTSDVPHPTSDMTSEDIREPPLALDEPGVSQLHHDQAQNQHGAQGGPVGQAPVEDHAPRALDDDGQRI